MGIVFSSFEDGGVLGHKGKDFTARGIRGSRKSEIDGFGGAGSNNEISSLRANGVGNVIFGGFVGFADALGREIGCRRVEKVFGKIWQHRPKSIRTDRSSSGMVEINHTIIITYSADFCAKIVHRIVAQE